MGHIDHSVKKLVLKDAAERLFDQPVLEEAGVVGLGLKCLQQQSRTLDHQRLLRWCK